MALSMPKVNTRSVRFRTTAGAALALLVLMAALGVAVDWFVGRQVQQAFDLTLSEQAMDRASLLDEGAPPDSLIAPVGDEQVVAVVAADGTVIASSGLADQAEISALPIGISERELTIIEPGEGPEREQVRIAVVEARSGERVIVANEGENTASTTQAVRNMLFAVVPLAAAAGALVAWLVTGRALQPVKSMRDELGDVVRAGDGRRVSEPGTGDEVDELGTTINRVLDRLDQQSLAQRRFVADASHELKSPLANAQAIIDTATPDEHERVTTAVGGELNRLRGLVDDLLFLARGDEGAPRSPQPVDLDDLIFDECERVAAMSAKHIDASGVIPATVTVDASEVARAIRNLIENAERFATERVRVSVRSHDETVTVVVADDGPGIAPEDRDTVFERFSRIDTDRARSAGGTGLGLSIVASIATRNGGAVDLFESPGGGAQFELSFPAQAGL